MVELEPGTEVAGCRIVAVAGRGGMGIVYRATQLRLKRDVALKAIAPELTADPVFHERFRREAQLAASVEHPNVLPVYEAGELDDGSLFLVTRWVNGADLATLLGEHGRLAPARAATLVAPVALALDAAHRRGLVHRDVKPANILVAAADEHVYLTDFGISRALGAQNITRTGMFVGTVAYAAPERLQGDRGAEPADIYSLGCVLFEALAGRPPFVRDTELETMHAHVYDPPPAVRELAPWRAAGARGGRRAVAGQGPGAAVRERRGYGGGDR